jgi:hypothetical protein
MQNQNQDDSERVAIIDFPPMPKLPPMPSMIPLSTILMIVFVGSMAAVCFSRSNWIGGCADLGIIALSVTFAVMRYRSMKELHRHHRNLLTIQKILTTPVMAEEGNSMILTFLRPSDRLMEEMNEIFAEVIGKKSPKSDT